MSNSFRNFIADLYPEWFTSDKSKQEAAERAAAYANAVANAEALTEFLRTQMRRMGLDYLAEEETAPILPGDMHFLILAPVLEQLLDRIEQLEHRLR